MGRIARSEASRSGRSRGGRSSAHGAAKEHKSHALTPIDRVNLNAQDDAAILIAVESLYADELKPYSRILRKRLCERSEKSSLAADSARLRARCEVLKSVLIEEEEGGEWSVLLAELPPNFIDVYSACDPYSAECWIAAESYFQSLPEAEALLPGGRYACASALAARNLSFLDGLSLGRLCHFVQLAISQRKLLGYRSGAVVPYALSLSKVKDSCASQQAPVLVPSDTLAGSVLSAEARGQWPVATWDEAQAGLKEILSAAFSKGDTFVPLSNLKRLFRTGGNLELSETSLGHAKLTELMQDVRMSGICQLKLKSFGYILLPPSPPATQPNLHDRGLQAGTASRVSYGTGCDGLQWWLNPFCGDSFACLENSVVGAQGPILLEESTVSPAGSLLDNIETEVASKMQSPTRFCADEPLEIDREDLQASDLYVPLRSGLSALSPQTLSSEGSLGCHLRNTFIHFASSTPSQLLGSARRSQSMPKHIGSQKSEWESSCNMLSYLHGSLGQRKDCCIEMLESSTECDTDQPSSLDGSASEEGSFDGIDDSLCPRAFCSNELTWDKEDECSLAAYVSMSLPVRNTFIDWAPEPPTPIPQAGSATRLRSSSLPKLSSR